MAVKHYTVTDTMNRPIPGRINDNFGLLDSTTSIPTITTSCTCVYLSTFSYASNLYYMTTGTLQNLTGGVIGQIVTLVSSSGNTTACNVVCMSNATYSSGVSNIVGPTGAIDLYATSGALTLIALSTDKWKVISS